MTKKKTKSAVARKTTTRKVAKPARSATPPATPELPPRTATKKDAVLALLRRDGGASLDELMTATAWQAHSLRGFISGTVRKKLGHMVVRVKRATGTFAYWVAREG